MSTTVTYKGSTLTTVNNQTRTLKTAGKYMEGDVILTDVTEGGGGVTVTDEANATGVGAVIVSGGGGGSKQETTGTVTGGGTNVLQIPCAFAPQEIYIRGDLTGDASLRGVVSFTAIKDRLMLITIDSSTSSTNEDVWGAKPISGYNEENSSTEPYASYSNAVLTIDTVVNSTSIRFASGISYSYDLVAYDGSPTPPSPDIPLNTQLIDYTAIVSGYIIDSNTGQEMESTWSSCSDFTLIDPSMTFSYIGYQWYYLAFYNSSKDFISSIYMNNDADSVTNDYAQGTLNSTKIPSTAKYVRISTYPNVDISSTELSLIRTA